MVASLRRFLPEKGGSCQDRRHPHKLPLSPCARFIPLSQHLSHLPNSVVGSSAYDCLALRLRSSYIPRDQLGTRSDWIMTSSSPALEASLRSVDETGHNSKVRTKHRNTIKDRLISSFVDVEESTTHMTDFQQKSISAFENGDDWAEFQKSCAKAHVTTTGEKTKSTRCNTVFQQHPPSQSQILSLPPRKSRREGDAAAISRGQSLLSV